MSCRSGSPRPGRVGRGDHRNSVLDPARRRGSGTCRDRVDLGVAKDRRLWGTCCCYRHLVVPGVERGRGLVGPTLRPRVPCRSSGCGGRANRPVDRPSAAHDPHGLAGTHRRGDERYRHRLRPPSSQPLAARASISCPCRCRQVFRGQRRASPAPAVNRPLEDRPQSNSSPCAAPVRGRTPPGPFARSRAASCSPGWPRLLARLQQAGGRTSLRRVLE